MEYNERKLIILDAVYELGEATSNDVYGHLDLDDDVSLTAVQMALLRYSRQGLLSRSGRKEKVYEITPKGEERLAWLKDLYE